MSDTLLEAGNRTMGPPCPHPDRACRLVEGADRTLLLDPQGGQGADWAVVRGGFLKEMPRS